MAKLVHLDLLKQGVEVWNKWRKENPSIKPDLQRANLEGANLEGANFSEANIQGVNFANANLRKVKFIGVTAGLPHRWVNIPLFLAFIILILSTFVFSFTFNLTQLLLFSGDLGNIILSLVSLILTVAYFVLAINKDFKSVSGIIIILVLSVLFIFVFIVAIAAILENAGIFAFLLPLSTIVTIVVIVTASIAVIVAEIIAGAVTYALSFVFSIAGVVIGIFAEESLFSDALRWDIYNISFYIARTIILCFLIAYISLKVKSVGKKKYSPFWEIAVVLTTIGSTSFRGADLTDADFTKAMLKSTDFTKAILIRTSWYHAKRLDLVHSRDTYLQNPKLRNLVITGEGQNENFDGEDLRSLNLCKANLENASFIDAKFYQANLQKANLSKTILVGAKFEGADLRDACLTGSCIQDWVITRETKIERILCDYVFLKWVNGDKRDQMPPRGKFKTGGFVTFVRYILETVELYHEKDINPRLALTVLQKMSRDYDEPLDIVALGKKGERVFIQVKVSKSITRENFKEDYYSRYDTDLKLWSGNIHQLPPAVDSFIEKRISEIASERTDNFVFVDAIYAEGNYTEIQQPGGNMARDRNIHMGSGNYNEHIDGDYVQGNKFDGSKQNLAQAAAEIKELLKQLEETYPTDSTANQMVVAAKAVEKIEGNPTLKQKAISAVTEGGIAAFEKAIDNPAGAFIAGAVKGWQEASK